jgi:hypothetical protein
MLALSLVALSACGGGGGGGGDDAGPTSPPTSNPPPTAGIGRTGLSVGPVTTFGSIVVNGVRYDTSSTDFTVDGTPGSESDLRVGDIVIVSGTVNDDGVTGTADSVIYDDIVTGPVESIDVAGNSLVVMGQVVLVRPETLFDDDFSPASLEGVAVDQVIEVSGVFDANGDIVASRIEPEEPGEEFEVQGPVTNLDSANSRFNIGTLTVDYSTATLEDFPGGEISEGDLVEASGSGFGASGEFIAASVELEDDFPDFGEDDYIEIEGYITRYVSAEDFDVSGIPVTTTSATEFEDGTAADLALNVKIEVEGNFNADSVLVAEEVEIERDNDVGVSATVDSVDEEASTVIVLGIPVIVGASTLIEDDSAAEVDPLTLADVNAGDYVEVRGRETAGGSGEILAARFERKDPEEDAELTGIVTEVSEPTLTILGVTIQTNGSTDFEDANGNPISSAAFFADVKVGSFVEVKGLESGDTTITAEEVEFESED